MRFTDEELKRLKKSHGIHVYACAHMGNEHIGLHDILTGEQFEALLLRLELAEKGCVELERLQDLISEEDLEIGMAIIQAWQKTAGKKANA